MIKTQTKYHIVRSKNLPAWKTSVFFKDALSNNSNLEVSVHTDATSELDFRPSIKE